MPDLMMPMPTLLRADRALVRHDRALPGLALLLDEATFTARLQVARPDLAVGPARATYVRYKAGTSGLVKYRIELNGVEQEIYAKGYGVASAADKLAKARQRLSYGQMAGLVLEEEALIVSFFPFDYKLKSLHRLADPERRTRMFRRLLRERPELWQREPRTLRYKPERRYVAKLGEGPDAVLVRLYTRRAYEELSTAPVVSSRGPLQLPTRVARSERYQALAFSWIPGLPLDEALERPGFDPALLSRVGAALSALHEQSGDGLHVRTADDEARALHAAANGVVAVSPALADRAHSLARSLAQRLFEHSARAVPIHGDFSADQVILNGDRVGIIDLDNLALGDPLVDLGTFVAQLARNGLLDGRPPIALERVVDALETGYGAGRLEQLPLYVAAGLLRLAPHAFRNRRPDWPRETEAVLDLAADWASRSA